MKVRTLAVAKMEYNKASGAELDDPHGDESLFDVLVVFLKNRRLIFGFPVIVGAITFAVSFAIPPTFRASTTILPPQQSQMGAAALLSQLGGAASMVASATGIKNPSDLYIGMLRSRTISDNLIGRFHLQSVYDVESLEQTRKELERNTSMSSGKEGLITITVEDGDKNRVAALANGYIEELTKVNRALAVTEAAQRRLFFQRQLEQAKNRLADDEVELKKNLDANGVISVDADSRGIVETIAKLRAQASVKEIQLSSMSSFVTTNNQDYKAVQQELSSLRAEISRLENGTPVDKAEKKTPSGLANIKILRDVKYSQMLYELLAKQYEAARLDEARDASLIQTLDAAIVPEKPYSPKHGRLAAIAMAIAFFLAILFAFARNAFLKALERPAFRERWAGLRKQLRFSK